MITLTIKEPEWKECIDIPLLEDKYIETGIYNLKLEMKNLGYLNELNEIVLDSNFTLTGFWNNFSYAFSKELVNIIFKKMEESKWEQ